MSINATLKIYMKKDIIIADAHNDFLTYFSTEIEIKKYIKKIETSPLKTLCCAIWTSEIKDIKKEFASLVECFKGLKSKVKLLLSVEDMFFIDETTIDDVIKLKPVSCSLTWNFDNNLAGGCKGNLGLTGLGKSIIKKLEENNILIDTAHLSREAFFELAAVTTKPLYNSHTCADALNNHIRNLTDEQIDLIVKSNGFIGICFVPNFISEKAMYKYSAVSKEVSYKDVALQFDYIIKKFGAKNVGLGTDYCGVEQLPQGLLNYCEVQNLFDELKTMGHNDEVISCIAHKNFEEFLKRNDII